MAHGSSPANARVRSGACAVLSTHAIVETDRCDVALVQPVRAAASESARTALFRTWMTTCCYADRVEAGLLISYQDEHMFLDDSELSAEGGWAGEVMGMGLGSRRGMTEQTGRAQQRSHS